jgi:hypothetical protein
MTSGDISRANASPRGDRRCLVFLHIPKTAGMTVGTSLRWNFRRRETIHLKILDKPLDEQLERIPVETRARARFLSGHMPYGAHRYLPTPCDYVTVLRDPIARVISVYKQILKDPRHVLHDRVVGTRTGLEEYVESGMDEGQTHNSQTRQLSGKQFGVVDDAALVDAKQNLEGFLVVGLTERFEETIALLRRAVGLRMPLYVTRNTSFPLEVSERARELIVERNELDRDLYSFACELFKDTVARQNNSFRSEVSMYEAWRPISRAAGATMDGALRTLSRSPTAKRVVGATRDFVQRRQRP